MAERKQAEKPATEKPQGKADSWVAQHKVALIGGGIAMALVIFVLIRHNNSSSQTASTATTANTNPLLNTSGDLSNLVGPAGPAGPPGPAGPAGPAGTSTGSTGGTVTTSTGDSDFDNGNPNGTQDIQKNNAKITGKATKPVHKSPSIPSKSLHHPAVATHHGTAFKHPATLKSVNPGGPMRG